MKKNNNTLPTKWLRVNHHSPSHMTQYLYAAFGSNLWLQQMAARCPHADLIGAGRLRGSRLIFARVCSIVPEENSDVLVGIYKLDAGDIAALDRFEGLGRSYDRVLVTPDMEGEAIRCFTYIKRNNEPEAPSAEYFGRVLKGFKDWRFPDRRLYRAKERAAKDAAKARLGRSRYDSFAGWEPVGASWPRGGVAKPKSEPTSTGWHEGVRGKWVKEQNKDWIFRPDYKGNEDVGDILWGQSRGGILCWRHKRGSVWYKDTTDPNDTSGRVKGIGPFDPQFIAAEFEQPPLPGVIESGDAQNYFRNANGEEWEKDKSGVWRRKGIN